MCRPLAVAHNDVKNDLVHIVWWLVCLQCWCLQCFDTVVWATGRASSLQKLKWWDACMVMCLGQGADLHMAQLMPLPLTISCSSKSRFDLPFWYQLTWVVMDKVQRAIKWMWMCVCLAAGMALFGMLYHIK